MSDILLDASGDIDLSAGDFQLVEGDAAVAQHAEIRLSTLKGEWFEDTRIGVDYFDLIFVRPFNKTLVDAHLKQALLTTPGVDSIVAYASTLDTVTRQLTVTAQLKLGDTTIDFRTVIEPEIGA